MAQQATDAGIGLPDRSVFSFRSDEKFSRWLLFSLIFHVALIGAIFLFPLLPQKKPPEYPVYTVDLVGGERIGRTNLGMNPNPVAGERTGKKEAASVAEPKKREVKETKEVKEAKKEKPEVKAKSKVVEPAPVPDKLAMKDLTKKEQPTRQPAREAAKREPAAEATKESKTETALENVRERLIQSAVERIKNKGEQKGSKGEAISSGTGEGQGAAALGPGGTGGGVPKGIDFIRYQNQMLSTIKNNWVWVGQRGNLRVTVRFNIKDNGEIVGLKLVQASGNASYDDSVLRAVRKSSPLPPPPEDVRRDFSEVELAFRPEDLGA
jgi:colicin import membrane protein